MDARAAASSRHGWARRRLSPTASAAPRAEWRAAELAVRSFIEGHLGQNETLGIQHNSARTVEAFNSWAHSIGRSDEKLAGMACTLTVLVLRGRQVHVIHVGDTRAYRWRDGRLDQMTTDHAMTGAGLRHILTRAVGTEEASASITPSTRCASMTAISCAATASMAAS